MAAFGDLHPEVERALGDGGWTEHRSISIDGWHSLLRAEGFRLSVSSQQVLESLGDLRIRPVNRGRYFHPLLSDPVLAGAGTYDVARRFADQFEQTFYPVAEWISNACAFVGVRGKVVSYDDIEMLDIADSFPEALDVMIRATHLPKVMG